MTNWLSSICLDDPTLCPACGSNMIVLAAISYPAQDDVIERVGLALAATATDPAPTDAARSPRRRVAEESGVPDWSPEHENQDPPGDW